MINRHLSERFDILHGLFPVVGIVGPRQCGKTTFVKSYQRSSKKSIIYLDLESPLDLAKLEEPVDYFFTNADKTIALDEIQRKPELFPILRGVIDRNKERGIKAGQFIILGSASVELLRQSSESLAGRVAYLEMTGFTINELPKKRGIGHKTAWVRGGFPDSYLAKNDKESYLWREHFITTYLERDIPQFGLNAPAPTLRKLWTMLAYQQGNVINFSNLARSLELSSPTITRYIDFMESMFLLRKLMPWKSNLGKRLAKTPKIYLRDSGIAHALLGIEGYEDLLSHPVSGFSWEGYVIENLLAHLDKSNVITYYRSAGGAEIDLIIERKSVCIAIEIKRSIPKVSKGFYAACDDIKATKKYVVYSGEDRFRLKEDVEAISLIELMMELEA